MVTVDPTEVKMLTAEEAYTATRMAELKSIKMLLQYIIGVAFSLSLIHHRAN